MNLQRDISITRRHPLPLAALWVVWGLTMKCNINPSHCDSMLKMKSALGGGRGELGEKDPGVLGGFRFLARCHTHTSQGKVTSVTLRGKIELGLWVNFGKGSWGWQVGAVTEAGGMGGGEGEVRSGRAL